MAGGVVSNNKGVNVPGVVLPLSPFTDKDRDDLALIDAERNVGQGLVLAIEVGEGGDLKHRHLRDRRR